MTSQIDRTEALAEAVRSVWRAVLPAEPFDPSLTWRDVGVDSLKGMEIALRIEKAAGIAVPFHLMTQDVSLGQFLKLLAEHGVAAEPADVGMFMVPGVYGDGPGLAELCLELVDQVQIKVLPLPDRLRRPREP